MLEKIKKFYKPFLFSNIMSIGFGAILLCLIAVLMMFVDVGDNIVYILTVAVLVLMAIFNGFMCGRIIKSKGLVMGALSGLTLAIIIAIVGIFFGTPITLILTKMLVIAFSSVIGGVVGVN